MAPFVLERGLDNSNGHGKKELIGAGIHAVILEAYGQGLTMGAIMILMLIVACNYRRHVTLHKLILLEQFLALFHACFIFFDDPNYGWYLSASSTLLFVSYELHNVIAFLKIKTFLPSWGRKAFIISLILIAPYWVIEAYDNFTYFNYGSNWNQYTRPWEPLARDPWWIFTTVYLCYKIKVGYDFTVKTLFKTSPRFGVMLFCMIASIGFAMGDVIVTAANLTIAKGLNPYWRLSLVFKCAADTIFLDDFKTVLDRILEKRFQKFSQARVSSARKESKGFIHVSKVSHASRKGSTGRAPSWMTPKFDKSVELECRGGSRDPILPTVPEAIVTIERVVRHESISCSRAAPAYNVNISADRE